MKKGTEKDKGKKSNSKIAISKLNKKEVKLDLNIISDNKDNEFGSSVSTKNSKLKDNSINLFSAKNAKSNISFDNKSKLKDFESSLEKFCFFKILKSSFFNKINQISKTNAFNYEFDCLKNSLNNFLNKFFVTSYIDDNDKGLKSPTINNDINSMININKEKAIKISEYLDNLSNDLKLNYIEKINSEAVKNSNDKSNDNRLKEKNNSNNNIDSINHISNETAKKFNQININQLSPVKSTIKSNIIKSNKKVSSSQLLNSSEKNLKSSFNSNPKNNFQSGKKEKLTPPDEKNSYIINAYNSTNNLEFQNSDNTKEFNEINTNLNEFEKLNTYNKEVNDDLSDIDNLELNENLDSNKLNMTNLSEDASFAECFDEKKLNRVSKTMTNKDCCQTESKEESSSQINNTKFNSYVGTGKNAQELMNKFLKKQENIRLNKNKLNNNYKQKIDKIKAKINEIKVKKEEEHINKITKIHNKFESFEYRHKIHLEERCSRAKLDKTRIDEINFIKKYQQSNKTQSLNKKMISSTNRRNLFMKERFENTIKDLKRIDEIKRKRNVLPSKEKMEYLQKVYNEDFIWKVLEADYFNIDDLIDLTNSNQYQIVKKKILNTYDKVQKTLNNNGNSSLYENFSNDDVTSTTKENTHLSKVNNLSQINQNFEANNAIVHRLDIIAKNKICYKKSRSFCNFTEDDYKEVNYLFKKNKNKKRKKDNNLKFKLLKSINSMSTSKLCSFFKNFKSAKRKTRKFLIKNRDKYLRAQATVYLIKDEDKRSNYSDEISECSKDNISKKLDFDNIENSNFNKSSLDNIKNKKHNKIDDLKEINKEETSKIINLFLSQNKSLINDDKESEKINEKENTLHLENELLVNLLEKIPINVKFCKICNQVLQSEYEVNQHVISPEHKKIKSEYNITLDDNHLLIVFNFRPGDVTEEIKSERINSIKLKFKKIKQNISIKALKHENFSIKNDYVSTNKQRIQKISFELEKMILMNSKDFETMENHFKELLKISEQKKQSDLHIFRQTKIIHYIFELMKKPQICYKSEIRALGKALEQGIKIIMSFVVLRENKTYLLTTNKITICIDLLIWLLNKPSKLPLSFNFIPDLVNLITVSLKFKLSYEYKSIKDDLVDYILYSNLLMKIKSKFIEVQGPLEITSNNLGSFPLFLIKSLQMIDCLLFQMNVE